MIPNILTTARLVLVPIFAYFIVIRQNLPAAAVIFILSGITDVADGYIARHFNMVTNFGKIYDPFVDKLMQITAIVCLTIAHIVPWWLPVIVVVKEAAMIVCGGILYLRKIVVHSNWYGKAATVIFYAIVFAFILWKDIPEVWSATLLVIMIGAVIFSAVAYLIDIIRHYDEKRISEKI